MRAVVPRDAQPAPITMVYYSYLALVGTLHSVKALNLYFWQVMGRRVGTAPRKLGEWLPVLRQETRNQRSSTWAWLAYWVTEKMVTCGRIWTGAKKYKNDNNVQNRDPTTDLRDNSESFTK